MKNSQLISVPLPTHLEPIGDGSSFQDTIYNMLTHVQGFEIFEQYELMFLAKHMKVYRVPAGVTIFQERDKNSHLGILVEGRICVYKEDSEDANKLFGFVTEGRIFGEVSVIDDLPYSASLITESDSTILLMSRESFRQCIADNSIIGVRLLKVIARLLCARLRSTSGKLADYIDV
ncbi:MAG: cyclic nucleotide-binding domain-containing protein [Gallionella sp.]|nr:cyclic nucleotide-binding domain-containing protein [Gallionella sp.]MDD4958027.1 cyclic nucleotide-binding domain-containing protein [Gallionella sp.]